MTDIATTEASTLTVSRAALGSLAGQAAALVNDFPTDGDRETLAGLVDLAQGLGRLTGATTDDPAADMRRELAELADALTNITGGDPADAGLAAYCGEIVARCGLALKLLEAERK